MELPLNQVSLSGLFRRSFQASIRFLNKMMAIEMNTSSVDFFHPIYGMKPSVIASLFFALIGNCLGFAKSIQIRTAKMWNFFI